MSTTYAQTIDGNKIYAERSVQDKDGNQIDTTYAKVASLATVATTGDYDDLANKPTINTKPVVAGSNIVITENTNNVSISTTGLQPSLPTISGHAGDVLTVNSQANAIEWAPSQGGTQVQADWAETSSSDPSYIQNKPTMNSLAAGSNISLNASGSTVTVAVTGLATVATSGDYGDLSNTPTIPSGAQLVPTATSADADKVLTVDAQGTPAWASAQAPISAGTGIDITNNVVSVDTSVVATQTDLAGKEDEFDVGTGLEMDTSGSTPTLQVEAPVDIVAGPGIVIDNPDGNTLRVSTNANYETVLYEDTSYTLGRTSVTLSESYKNFEIIKVFTNKGDVVFLKTDNPQSVNTCTLTHFNGANIWSIPWTFTDNTTFTGAPGVMLYSDSGTIKSVTVGSDAPYGRWEQPVKIVGIHRIANN